MTASEVIVSGNAVLRDSPLFTELCTLGEQEGIPHLFKWESLTGEALCEQAYDYGSRHWEKHVAKWHETVASAASTTRFIDCGDSFVLYEFGGVEQS
jgi:hypothetical protein